MDKTFQKFLRSGIDLSPVGVERREGNNPYFCTPKGCLLYTSPAFLMILTGTGDFAYRRPDGVCVVPIGCLKN